MADAIITKHVFRVSQDPRPPTHEKTEAISLKVMAALSEEPVNDVVNALVAVLGSVSADTAQDMNTSILLIAKISRGLTSIARTMHGLSGEESEADAHNRVTLEAAALMAKASRSPDGFLTMLESLTVGALMLHQGMVAGSPAGPEIFAQLLSERVRQRLAVATAPTDGLAN